MSELLPCPFCGGEAEFERIGDRRQSCIVVCADCGCRHESSDEGQGNGASWNRRHTPPGWQMVPESISDQQVDAVRLTYGDEHARAFEDAWDDAVDAAPKPGGDS